MVQTLKGAEMEEWKDVEGYEGLYQVSSCGRVKSAVRNDAVNQYSTTENILKPCAHKNGYLFVNLYKNSEMRTFSIHRLVASAFIDNPLELPQVNHIDEDKTNNAASNLEWCEATHNARHGTRSERIAEKHRKPVLMMKNGEVIARFRSASDAAREMGFDNSNIGKCCKGILKSAHGYEWKYDTQQS